MIESIHTNTDNYLGKLLDEIIFYASNSGDANIIEGTQPREITQLVEKLSAQYIFRTVYNPFGGVGSYYTMFNYPSKICYSQ